MNNRLARIEREALSVGSFQRKMSRAPGVMADDVLALVEIAKAARWFASDGNRTTANDPAWQRLSTALSVLDDREET